MKNSTKPLVRRDGIIMQESADEILLYDLNTNKASCLNSTAALVWKYCDGKNEVNEIARLIEKDVKSAVPVELVWVALDQLEKENLLQEKPVNDSAIAGLSRREVMRRVAIGSLIALPVVSALAFPQGTLAATCPAAECGTMGSCTGAGELCCRTASATYACVTTAACPNPC